MNPIVIRVDGNPVGKGRARSTKTGIHYTPAKTKRWETTAQVLAQKEMLTRSVLEGPVNVFITAEFPVPRSWPAWKRNLANNGALEFTSKPDGDNVTKAALDAISKGIVIQDDTQVVRHSCLRKYSKTPGVTIEVVPIPKACSQTRTKAEYLALREMGIPDAPELPFQEGLLSAAVSDDRTHPAR